MKQCLKTFFIGLEIALLGIIGIVMLASGIMLLFSIHASYGWIAVLKLLIAILCVVFGTCFIWFIGEISNDNNNDTKKNEEV